MNKETVLGVVEALNERLIEKLGDSFYHENGWWFLYVTDGSSEYIKLNNTVIYSSDEDYRNWDESKGDYDITLFDHILQLLNKQASSLLRFTKEEKDESREESN